MYYLYQCSKIDLATLTENYAKRKNKRYKNIVLKFLKPKSNPVPAPDFTLARRHRRNPVQAMSPSVQAL